jgi:hypothetical protein
MEITKELKETMAQALGQAHISDKTAQDMILICKHGLTARDALKYRGVDKVSPDTLTDIKKKSQKVLLACPELQRLSHDAAQKILEGKPIIGEYEHKGEMKENVILPKASHVVAVMDMVTKRTEPIKSNEGSGGDTYNFVQINADKYRAQDIVSHETGEDGPETISI